MSVEDFSLVLDRVGPFQGVFHLHGFGEALLDRQFVPKLELLKQKNPSALSLIFSTLGVRVPEDHFTKMLNAGLDAIVISLYGFTKDEYRNVHGFDGFALVQRNLELLSSAMRQSPKKFHAIVKIPSSSLVSTLPIAEAPEKRAFCQWLQELGFELGEWGYVHNYSDGRNYNPPNAEKLCPVIEGRRKNILNVTWDLSVIPCCYDFNGTIRFGNLREQTLEEIFSSSEYLRFVLAHKIGDLGEYPVCQNCEKSDYV